MIIIRILAIVCWVLAVVTLGIDLMAYVEMGDLTFTSLGAWWFSLHAPSFNSFQVLIERYIWPLLWDPVTVTVLRWPACAVFGGLAILFTLISRRRGRFRLFGRR